jgi:hypothetical protein
MLWFSLWYLASRTFTPSVHAHAGHTQVHYRQLRGFAPSCLITIVRQIMARASFSPIKKALAKHDRQALVALVGELYALSAQNRDFLDARFAEGDSVLQRYKKTIHDALYPYFMSSDPVSFRDAKNAISDYRKALGEEVGIAELFVYAAECGNQFTCDYGDIDESFYDSLIRMFDSAVKHVSALDAKAARPFVARLAVIVKKAEGIGWGYYDCIADSFCGAFPDAKIA